MIVCEYESIFVCVCVCEMYMRIYVCMYVCMYVCYACGLYLVCGVYMWELCVLVFVNVVYVMCVMLALCLMYVRYV